MARPKTLHIDCVVPVSCVLMGALRVGFAKSAVANLTAEHPDCFYDCPQDEGVARALLLPQLSPAEDVTAWLDPYRALGFSEHWLDAIQSLRLSGSPGHVQVAELKGEPLDVSWQLCDDGSVKRPNKTDRGVRYSAPFGLPVFIDRSVTPTVTLTREATSKDGAVRPWQADPSVDALVRGAAAAIRRSLPDPAKTMPSYVLEPLCSVASTVWGCFRNLQVQHKGWLVVDGVDAARIIEAVAHRTNVEPLLLERLLVRNHPLHIPVSVGQVDPARLEHRWRGRLAFLKRLDCGDYTLDLALPNDVIYPRILTALELPEPV